eukprot:2770651-Prymnesium_polylepis.1
MTHEKEAKPKALRTCAAAQRSGRLRSIRSDSQALAGNAPATAYGMSRRCMSGRECRGAARERGGRRRRGGGGA